MFRADGKNITVLDGVMPDFEPIEIDGGGASIELLAKSAVIESNRPMMALVTSIQATSEAKRNELLERIPAAKREKRTMYLQYVDHEGTEERLPIIAGRKGQDPHVLVLYVESPLDGSIDYEVFGG